MPPVRMGVPTTPVLHHLFQNAGRKNNESGHGQDNEGINKDTDHRYFTLIPVLGISAIVRHAGWKPIPASLEKRFGNTVTHGFRTVIPAAAPKYGVRRNGQIKIEAPDGMLDAINNNKGPDEIVPSSMEQLFGEGCDTGDT